MLPSDELGLGLSPKPARPSFLGGPSPPESPVGFFELKIGKFWAILGQSWTDFW